jgi:hypothetical protein
VDNVDGVEPQAFFWRRVVQLVRACHYISVLQPTGLHDGFAADGV